MRHVRSTIAILLIFSIIIIDQVIKVAVKTNLNLHEQLDIAPWFKILFTENEGMAFGMDFIGTVFLTVFRMVAVVFFIYCLVKVIRKRYPLGFIVCLSMIIAGAAGNIIDNCFYGLIFSESFENFLFYAAPARMVDFGYGYGNFLSGKVVDMFYFPLFKWPQWMPVIGGDTFFGAIFNFADASISCGAVAMLLFYSKYVFDGKQEQQEELLSD